MIRDKIYLFGILLLVVGLSFSRALTSISYVILIATWLIDPKVFQKFGSFFKNKPALILSSIYFMHLVGLIYTTDFNYAWLEIRTKIPLFILPLIFSTMRLPTKKEFVLVLVLFSLSVIATWGTSMFFFFRDSPLDFREVFHFNSHIRLSLMAVLAVSIFGWLSFKPELRTPFWAKIFMMILSLLLIWMVAVLEVMSGLLLLFLAGIIVGLIFIIRRKTFFAKIVKIGIPVFAVSIMVLLSLIIRDYWSVEEFPNQPTVTALGNPYLDLESDFPIENGSPIGRMVCWTEMREGWNARSEFKFDSINETGFALSFSLLRYLNSKHLTKDLEGVKSLNKSDIEYIEMGFANFEYTKKFSLKKRIYKLLWEYDMYRSGGDINSSSALKRFFLWNTGLNLVKSHPLFGIGTGDVKKEFKKQLIKDNSPLEEAGLRTHNQWISIAIAFGIIGLIWFVFSIFYPLLKLQQKDFLLVSFFVVYLISMFWEDSLETQIGVTIFGFFYPFFLFLNPFLSKKKRAIELDDD